MRLPNVTELAPERSADGPRRARRGACRYGRVIGGHGLSERPGSAPTPFDDAIRTPGARFFCESIINGISGDIWRNLALDGDVASGPHARFYFG